MAELVEVASGMTFEVAHRSAASFTRDLLGAAPVAVLRATAAALAVAALGQIPPSLVNVAGGLAVATQLGWAGSTRWRDMRSRSPSRGPAGRWRGTRRRRRRRRLGMLTIAASRWRCSWSVPGRRPGGP